MLTLVYEVLFLIHRDIYFAVTDGSKLETHSQILRQGKYHLVLQG